MATSHETLANGNGNGGSKEAIGRSDVEVRFANFENEKDIEAVTAIWAEEDVIPHLASVAPELSPRDFKKFRAKLPELMPNVPVDPNEVIIATKKEVGEYLKSKDPSKSRLLIAQSVGPKPEVLGTVLVEKPGGGITYVSVAKLAVSEKARRKGVGSALIKSATAFGLGKVEDGGWAYSGASAGIIQVAGSEKPQTLFQRNRYQVQATRPNGCISWDFETDKFVSRDVLLVILDGANYKADPAFLPKKAA